MAHVNLASDSLDLVTGGDDFGGGDVGGGDFGGGGGDFGGSADVGGGDFGGDADMGGADMGGGGFEGAGADFGDLADSGFGGDSLDQGGSFDSLGHAAESGADFGELAGNDSLGDLGVSESDTGFGELGGADAPQISENTFTGNWEGLQGSFEGSALEATYADGTTDKFFTAEGSVNLDPLAPSANVEFAAEHLSTPIGENSTFDLELFGGSAEAHANLGGNVDSQDGFNAGFYGVNAGISGELSIIDAGVNSQIGGVDVGGGIRIGAVSGEISTDGISAAANAVELYGSVGKSDAAVDGEIYGDAQVGLGISLPGVGGSAALGDADGDGRYEIGGNFNGSAGFVNWDVNASVEVPQAVNDAVIDGYHYAADGAVAAYDYTAEAVGHAYDATTTAVGQAYDATTTAVGQAYDNTTQAVGQAYDTTSTAVGNAYDNTTTAVGNAYNNTTAAVGNAANATYETAASWSRWAFGY